MKNIALMYFIFGFVVTACITLMSFKIRGLERDLIDMKDEWMRLEIRVARIEEHLTK